MKSKTSFFNVSLLHKDLVRFAPAWALYGVFLLLIFGGSVFSDNQSSLATSLSSAIPAFAIINLFFAMLCAQLLFGDLFQSRMCNALHALPIRRESWFATHVLAGLLFSAIPVTVVGLIFLAALGNYWLAALLWISALSLQFLFFFSLATFSVMLVGNRFAAVLVYTILNFIAIVALWLFTFLYQPYLYGFIFDKNRLLQFFPVSWMIHYDWFASIGTTHRIIIGDGWGYLGICALVGIGLLTAALLLYRKRALEKAGDFIVYKSTSPIFTVLYTFCAGTTFYLFSRSFVGNSQFIFLLLGLVIGYFTARMLLDRTIRVFRAKAFARLGILIAVFVLTLLLTILDPLGITSWVPREAEVQSVSLGFGEYDFIYYEGDAVSNKDLIRQVISIHQHAVAHPEEADNGKEDVLVKISYRLKNGSLVIRQYCVDWDTSAAITLQNALTHPEMIFGSKYPTAQTLAEQLQMAEIRFVVKEADPQINPAIIVDPQHLQALAEALYTDALAGNLLQDPWFFPKDYTEQASIFLQTQDRSGTWTIVCTNEATHTLAWLAENVK